MSPIVFGYSSFFHASRPFDVPKSYIEDDIFNDDKNNAITVDFIVITVTGLIVPIIAV